MLTCERCPITKNLLRFYDELNGGSCSLCAKCFRWFANGRRKGGLPVPNAKQVNYAAHEVRLTLAVSLALCLLVGLVACDGGSDSVDMTGTQKCTVTVNEKEKPCH